MASLSRPFLTVQPVSPSLETIEIEPTQVSYPRLRTIRQKLVERRREETFADIIKLVRQSPASPVFTGTPGHCPSTRGNKSCYFTEPTDDTDEIVSPRQPPSTVLRPSDHGRHHHSHHKSCVHITPFAYSQQERVRHVSFDSSVLHLEATLRGHRNSVTVLECLGSSVISGSSDYTLKLWHLSEERFQVQTECVHTVTAHKSRITCLARLDEATVCSVGVEPLCYLWSVKPEKLKRRRKVDLQTSPTAILCPSPLTLLCGSPSGRIYVTSLESISTPIPYTGHSGAVMDMASISPNTFLSASFDTSVRLWDFRTKESITVMNEHRDCVNRVMQWDDYAFFSAAEDGVLKKWDLRTCTVVQTMRADDPIRDIERVRDRVVTSHLSVSVWSGKSSVSASPHTQPITCLRYSAEHDLLLTGSHDCTLSVLRACF